MRNVLLLLEAGFTVVAPIPGSVRGLAELLDIPQRRLERFLHGIQAAHFLERLFVLQLVRTAGAPRARVRRCAYALLLAFRGAACGVAPAAECVGNRSGRSIAGGSRAHTWGLAPTARHGGCHDAVLEAMQCLRAEERIRRCHAVFLASAQQSSAQYGAKHDLHADLDCSRESTSNHQRITSPPNALRCGVTSLHSPSPTPFCCTRPSQWRRQSGQRECRCRCSTVAVACASQASHSAAAHTDNGHLRTLACSTTLRRRPT